MSWQFAIIGHSLLSAVSIIIARKLSIKNNKYGYGIILLLFSAILTLGVLANIFFIDDKISIPTKNIYLLLLFCGGLLFALRNYLIFEFYNRLSASVGVIVSILNTLAVVLFATLILGESLTIIQYFGALLMLASIYVVSVKPLKKDILKHKQGIIIGLLNAAIFGLAITNEKYLLNEIGTGNYLIFGWGFQLVGAVILSLLNRKKVHFPEGRNMALLVAYVLFFAIGGALFIASLVGSDNASQVASLSGLKVVFTVILGYVLLKERQNTQKVVIGSILAFLGLFFLFL